MVRGKGSREISKLAKILRASQEPKESVYADYERLMQIFTKYSGVKDPEKNGVCGFGSAFVNFLYPEISIHLQQTVMCWQAKGIDEIC